MNSTFIVLVSGVILFCSQSNIAQSINQSHDKARVYGEVGLGLGQTLFFGDMRSKLSQSYGGSFDPGTGNNIMMGFYYSPARWKGLGLGSRVKGTFGNSVKGDYGDSYIFNYYTVAITTKYYPITQEFNRGLYVRASAGFGQLTTKRVNESTNLYKHQYAIGSTLMGGIGWTFMLGKKKFSAEAEFEYSSRNGTIDGVGSVSYATGQLGANIIWSF